MRVVAVEFVSHEWETRYDIGFNLKIMQQELAMSRQICRVLEFDCTDLDFDTFCDMDDKQLDKVVSHIMDNSLATIHLS